MKTLKKFSGARKWLLAGGLFAFLYVGLVVQSEAQIYTLSQNDSSVQINLTNGVSNWQVDSVDQLDRQWLYYRVGGMSQEYSIDAIASPSGVSFNPAIPRLIASYTNATISVKTTYSLLAPGDGTATLTEAITVKNTSAVTSDYHFFQYSDFNLAGVSGGQSVQFYYNGLTNNNGSPLYNRVIQTSGTISLSETVNVPLPVTGFEVQAGLNDGTLLGLADGSPTTLNNTLSAGPGDVVYAYEWDATLAPGSSFTLSKITTVPEPSSVALITSGMLALAWRHRRQRAFSVRAIRRRKR